MQYFKKGTTKRRGKMFHIVLSQRLGESGSIEWGAYGGPVEMYSLCGVEGSSSKIYKGLREDGYCHHRDFLFRAVPLISDYVKPRPYLNNVICVVKYKFGYPDQVVCYDSLPCLIKHEGINRHQMDRIMRGEKNFTSREKRHIFTLRLMGYEKTINNRRGGFRAPKYPMWWKDTAYALGLDDLKRVYRYIGGEWILKKAYEGNNNGRAILYGVPPLKPWQTEHMKKKRLYKHFLKYKKKKNP